MKKLMTLIFLLLCVSAVVGCQAVEDADDVADIRGGRCNLQKTVGFNLRTIHCFDFIDGYAANTASDECTQMRADYASSLGEMNGNEFTSGDANACEASGSVGSCTVANRGVMFYYSVFWNAGAAQSDCTSQFNGIWNP